MPLAVRDFTWEETEKMLFITVPLKGVKANKVDILSSENYIKVSFPPYLFECFLFGSVDDRNSKAQVGNGAVTFSLQKKEPEIWSQLQADYKDDKNKTKEIREEAIKRNQEQAEEDRKTKAENKRNEEKYALTEMMKLEDLDRERIDTIKNTEKQKAMDELEHWKEEQRKLAEMEKQKLLDEKLAEEAELRAERKKQEKLMKKKKDKGIFEDSSGGIPTRQSGKIEIKFTPRVFPTPVRESVTPQEEEWLKKQQEARKIAELEDADLTEEEKNPQFLKDKGNAFFQSGNYQAAINAYSLAIRLNPKMPALYSNRAACHLKIRNFFKCIEDSSKAIDLLHPPVPQNAASRCKAFVRRGTAFCELEMYVEGLQDYEAALKIDPKNEQLQADAEKMRQVIQSSSGTIQT